MKKHVFLMRMAKCEHNIRGEVRGRTESPLAEGAWNEVDKTVTDIISNIEKHYSFNSDKLNDAPKVRSQNVNIIIWYSSLKRSEETAFKLKEYLNNKTKACSQDSPIFGKHFIVSLEKEPLFDEIDLGVWEGKTPTEIKDKYPKDFKRFFVTPEEDFKIPGSNESLSIARQRGLTGLIKVLDSQNETDVFHIIISHGGINRLIISALLRISIGNIWVVSQNNLSLTAIGFADVSGGSPQEFILSLLDSNRKQSHDFEYFKCVQFDSVKFAFNHYDDEAIQERLSIIATEIKKAFFSSHPSETSLRKTFHEMNNYFSSLFLPEETCTGISLISEDSMRDKITIKDIFKIDQDCDSPFPILNFYYPNFNKELSGFKNDIIYFGDNDSNIKYSSVAKNSFAVDPLKYIKGILYIRIPLKIIIKEYLNDKCTGIESRRDIVLNFSIIITYFSTWDWKNTDGLRNLLSMLDLWVKRTFVDNTLVIEGKLCDYSSQNTKCPGSMFLETINGKLNYLCVGRILKYPYYEKKIQTPISYTGPKDKNNAVYDVVDWIERQTKKIYSVQGKDVLLNREKAGGSEVLMLHFKDCTKKDAILKEDGICDFHYTALLSYEKNENQGVSPWGYYQFLITQDKENKLREKYANKANYLSIDIEKCLELLKLFIHNGEVGVVGDISKHFCNSFVFDINNDYRIKKYSTVSEKDEKYVASNEQGTPLYELIEKHKKCISQLLVSDATSISPDEHKERNIIKIKKEYGLEQIPYRALQGFLEAFFWDIDSGEYNLFFYYPLILGKTYFGTMILKIPLSDLPENESISSWVFNNYYLVQDSIDKFSEAIQDASISDFMNNVFEYYIKNPDKMLNDEGRHFIKKGLNVYPFLPTAEIYEKDAGVNQQEGCYRYDKDTFSFDEYGMAIRYYHDICKEDIPKKIDTFKETINTVLNASLKSYLPIHTRKKYEEWYKDCDERFVYNLIWYVTNSAVGKNYCFDMRHDEFKELFKKEYGECNYNGDPINCNVSCKRDKHAHYNRFVQYALNIPLLLEIMNIKCNQFILDTFQELKTIGFLDDIYNIRKDTMVNNAEVSRMLNIISYEFHILSLKKASEPKVSNKIEEYYKLKTGREIIITNNITSEEAIINHGYCMEMIDVFCANANDNCRSICNHEYNECNDGIKMNICFNQDEDEKNSIITIWTECSKYTQNIGEVGATRNVKSGQLSRIISILNKWPGTFCVTVKDRCILFDKTGEGKIEPTRESNTIKYELKLENIKKEQFLEEFDKHFENKIGCNLIKHRSKL